MYININGKFYKEAEAKISVLDRGFLYGDGIFETMRVYNGNIFALDEHLKRLRSSARTILLKIPKSDKEIKKELSKTLERNGLRSKNAILKMEITRGVGPFGLGIKECNNPTMVIGAREFHSYPEEYYSKGVSVTFSRKVTRYSSSFQSRIKSANYLSNILAKSEADDAGAFEAILLNEDGYVTEGTVSNVFVVKNGTLVTPPLNAGVLAGITRGVVLKLARGLKIKTQEKLFKPDFVYACEECFLTNVSIEILPVVKVNGRIISLGKSGEITLELKQEFAKFKGFK